MIQSIIQGVSLGVLLSFLLGPVFFMILKLSITQGKRQAFLFNSGVLFCDCLVILLAYFGLSSFLQNQKFQLTIGIIGGSILIISAIVSLIKNRKPVQEIDMVLSKKRVLFAKGFFINLSNPFVWLFWIASVGAAGASFGNKQIYVLNYFISCIITCIIFDFGKIYLANSLRNFLNAQRMLFLNKIVQIALILFGSVLIYKVISIV